MAAPNILLLMTDQQRADSLGCSGAGWARTPNLDRLAASGAMFSHCYADNPICTPARASLLTGKPVPEHGVYRVYDDLPAEEVLLPARLRDLGYQTALFGKLHVSSIEKESYQRHPHDGFEIYEPCIAGSVYLDAPYQAYARWLEGANPELFRRLRDEPGSVRHIPREWHLSHWAAERTMSFLEHRDQSRPFFAMMSIVEPHDPYDGYPAGMEEQIDAAAIPAPIEAIDPDEPADLERERRHSYVGDHGKFSAEEIRVFRRDYHAAVANCDLEFGRVLARLAELGLAENTLVIFTSDHGDQLGDHRHLVKGAALYEATVRVPLLMRWPRALPAGRQVAGLVQTHDLAATMLAAAGLPDARIAEVMPDSRSVLPLARDGTATGRDTVICAYRNSGIMDARRFWDPPIHAEMIRDRRYKLVLYHDTGGTRGGDQGQLFDLARDPHELRNLWRDGGHAAIRARLTAALEEWNRRWDRHPPSRGGTTLRRQKSRNALK